MTVREHIEDAYKLLEFGHDPVNGSWQIPPDPQDVHEAGYQLKLALEKIDALVES